MVNQLFKEHRIYSRTSGLRSRQSSLVRCFLAVGIANKACGSGNEWDLSCEKRRRRHVVVGRLITELINLASEKYGNEAYNICVALAAAPEEKFSFGMQLVRSCPLKDISYVAGRVYAILENHPDAAWQKIDPSFAFDPARMISATDLPYAAARETLGLTAPELPETSARSDLPAQMLLTSSMPSERDQRSAIADSQLWLPMILQVETPQDEYPTHLTSQARSHKFRGSWEGHSFAPLDEGCMQDMPFEGVGCLPSSYGQAGQAMNSLSVSYPAVDCHNANPVLANYEIANSLSADYDATSFLPPICDVAYTLHPNYSFC
ncbi:hypothetical protein LTR91_020840 [Friedmanniomyces endolithicus]|uniref:Uncharacterized protein n=1 Tax=Friedmanniomyces endolithicus TaxID=329885 RepID=A0AAN6K3M0_9PEZI|nr:hypothetical protein LTR57_018909 [Friedmanniomyces endolithicus]KAK0959464.1 hypothetical protein LTR91_020840 [Friedmanniomyces endolithicus]KAK1022735.1 hypothetical protein LTS16_025479 [Friedmanniomyces endolithicus]